MKERPPAPLFVNEDRYDLRLDVMRSKRPSFILNLSCFKETRTIGLSLQVRLASFYSCPQLRLLPMSQSPSAVSHRFQSAASGTATGAAEIATEAATTTRTESRSPLPWASPATSAGPAPTGSGLSRRSHPKSRTGCQTCKRRKIKVRYIWNKPIDRLSLLLYSLVAYILDRPSLLTNLCPPSPGASSV